nr:hypothetical protein [Tanacetum cinerariifolium]
MGMMDIPEDVDEGEEMAQREEIFKDPHILKYYCSSSTVSDDDNNDDNNGSELGDDKCDEDCIQMVRQAQEEERNDPHYTDDHNDEECVLIQKMRERKMIREKIVKKRCQGRREFK